MKNISASRSPLPLGPHAVSGRRLCVFPLKKNTLQGRLVDPQDGQRQIRYDGAKPASPKVKILDGVLVAEATGESTKIAGQRCRLDRLCAGKLLFVKYYPY